MTEHDFNHGSGHGEVPEDSDQAFVLIARQLAEENTRIEPPAALIDRIESRLKPTRRHVRGWWTPALAAAAVVALAATAWIPFSGRLPGSDPPGYVKEPRGGRDDRPTRVHVTLAPEAPYFAVPVKTGSPDVSIVLLYRDVRPRRESPQIRTPSTQRSET